MNTLIPKIKTTVILCAVICVPLFTSAEEVADKGGANETKIEIKDFAFNPKTITVKSGDKITWINRDKDPPPVVSVEKQFKKSPAPDPDQQFTVTAGAPGTYTYYCSVHPKMTG